MNLIKDATNRNLGLKPHRCRICGSEGDFQSYLVREMFQNTREEFEYFICPSCECLQIVKCPDDIARFYGENYYSFVFDGVDQGAFEKPVTNMKKILDVGCGSGLWLYALAMEGYGNLFGCDPFLNSEIKIGDRVCIKNCSIHEIEGNGTYEWIHMGDSFEHMDNPLDAMRKASDLLTDNGILEMAVPTYPNIAFDMFESHWFQIDAPRHFFIPSITTLNTLAEKSRLRIIKRKYDSNYTQVVMSFFYQHGIPLKEITQDLIKEYFSDEDIKNIVDVCNSSNINGYGDHMIVYFSKV